MASYSPWGHKFSDMTERLTQHCKIHHRFIILNSNFSCVCLCLVAQSCPTRDPMYCSPPGSSVRRDSPGKHTGVHCQASIQEFLPTQVSNPGLPHCRQILYHLSHQGSHIHIWYCGLYIYHDFFIHLLMDISVTCMSWLLPAVLQWASRYMYLFEL